MVAATFGTQTIAHAALYWMEQIPYTTEFATLAAGTQESLFALTGWNPSHDPRTVVAVDQIAATPIPGVQLIVTNDTHVGRYDLGTWAGQWSPVPVDRWASRNVSITALNAGTQAAVNVRMAYRMLVWQEPIAVRILRGYALTPQDQQIARALQVETTAALQRGTTPILLDRVIQGTYANRQVAAPLNFAQLVTPSPTPQNIHRLSANANQLLVLRSVAAACNWEDQVTLTVNRDSDQAHVQINLAAAPLNRPLTLFVPALQSLTFDISAATTLPGPIPIRLEIWTVALSAILRARMSALTQTTLQTLQQDYGAQAGAKLWDHIRMGMV